jgi:hypothetical protein
MTTTKTESDRRYWITNSFFFDFIAELGIATIGASILAIFVAIAAGVVTASLTRNTTGGGFMDQVAAQPSRLLIQQPYYVGIVLGGFVLGTFSHRFFRPRAAYWVWIIPAGILVWNIFTWEAAPSQLYWPDVWNNYFGSDCGGSECVYEVFVTVPFYSSFAYALGSIATALVRRSADGSPS